MNEFKDDLDIILKSVDIPARQLAKELGFDEPTICNWLNGKYEPDIRSKEDIYSYAYDNGLRLNIAYEEPINKLGKKQNFVHLYHGSKHGIEGELNLDKSYPYNDLGRGFYLGESLEQSAMFISDSYRPKVYSFGLITKNLKIVEYDVCNDWVLATAYYRKLLNEYENSKVIKKIINRIEKADVVIAPIADNRMIDIINKFVEGYISIEACRNSLVAFNLGKQYVLKTNKAIDNLGIIKEYYLCRNEILDYRNSRNKLQSSRMKEIKNYTSKYRNGKYIDTLL